MLFKLSVLFANISMFRDEVIVKRKFNLKPEIEVFLAMDVHPKDTMEQVIKNKNRNRTRILLDENSEFL